MKTLNRFALAVAGVALLVAGVAAQKVQIQGAGATFPNPIYQKWISEYNKLHPNVEINYQSLGSGAGIRQLTAGTVFFGASDGPMTNEQLQAAPGKVLHFPMVLGAKKGLPNFNEFVFQTAVQVTRKLELVRPSTDSPPNQTNQMTGWQLTDDSPGPKPLISRRQSGSIVFTVCG